MSSWPETSESAGYTDLFEALNASWWLDALLRPGSDETPKMIDDLHGFLKVHWTNRTHKGTITSAHYIDSESPSILIQLQHRNNAKSATDIPAPSITLSLHIKDHDEKHYAVSITGKIETMDFTNSAISGTDDIVIMRNQFDQIVIQIGKPAYIRKDTLQEYLKSVIMDLLKPGLRALANIQQRFRTETSGILSWLPGCIWNTISQFTCDKPKSKIIPFPGMQMK